MRLVIAATALSCMPTAAAQQVSGAEQNSVTVSVAHLTDPRDSVPAPRLLPFEGAPPLAALRALRRVSSSSMLRDLVTCQGRVRFGPHHPVATALDGDELVAEADGVDRGDLSAMLLDAVEAFAPAVVLHIGVYRPAPGAAPVVLRPSEVHRFVAGAPLYSSTVERATGHIATVEAAGPDGQLLRMRIEPHLLATPGSIALLCELEFDRKARDESRRWTAATASGVVASGGALALTLPDCVVVVRAHHDERATKRVAGVAWSQLTTSSLWLEPDLIAGPEVLRLGPAAFENVALAGGIQTQRPFDTDSLMAHVHCSVRPKLWDAVGGLTSEGVPWRLLVAAEGDVLHKTLPALRAAMAELEKPLSETAQLDCVLPVEPQPAVPALVRLPVLPGRVACVLHAAWTNGEARAGLVALRLGAASGEVTGIGVRLRGARLTDRDGEPVELRAELARDGATALAESAELRVEIGRPR